MAPSKGNPPPNDFFDAADELGTVYFNAVREDDKCFPMGRV